MTRWTNRLSADRHSPGQPGLRPLSRRAVLVVALQSIASLAACTMLPPDRVDTPASPPVTPQSYGSAPVQNPECMRRLPTVVPPTPIPYPGYAQQEPETSLHVTGTALPIDLSQYRLLVSGLVDRPLSLSYDDLRCLPKVEAEVELTCPGYFMDVARLAGPTLASVVALAVPQAGAHEVTLIAVDGYKARFLPSLLQGEENFLAHEWRGEPLPASHGFPVRAVLPGKMGNSWVKWLSEIRLS
jgi:DMSO/TMAO reductase YedYZ molybdopterin-dependent catalytic subunit